MPGGGAASSALRNKNALTHGLCTRDAIDERRDLMRRSRPHLKEIE
jgi:hypothetical protein